jgi:hypothetical protein
MNLNEGPAEMMTGDGRSCSGSKAGHLAKRKLQRATTWSRARASRMRACTDVMQVDGREATMTNSGGTRGCRSRAADERRGKLRIAVAQESRRWAVGLPNEDGVTDVANEFGGRDLVGDREQARGLQERQALSMRERLQACSANVLVRRSRRGRRQEAGRRGQSGASRSVVQQRRAWRSLRRARPEMHTWRRGQSSGHERGAVARTESLTEEHEEEDLGVRDVDDDG